MDDIIDSSIIYGLADYFIEQSSDVAPVVVEVSSSTSIPSSSIVNSTARTRPIQAKKVMDVEVLLLCDPLPVPLSL